MASAEEDSDRLLSDYTNGFMVSQVLFAACELGVFDLLAEAPGPLSSAAVAAGLGTSPEGTELLLDTCVSLKLLRVDTGGGRALYGSTELSRRYLARNSPTSQHHILLYLAKTTYLCWGHLAQAVRDGKNQYVRAFGVPSEEVFAAIYRREGRPGLCIQVTRPRWALGQSEGLDRTLTAGPLRCVPGDFFKDPLPEADLYVLARILHDWSPEKCAQLLARVHRACRPGGGLLVIESLLDADGRGPLTTQLFSLNMLVQTEGRERTPAQYRALLAAAGFTDVQCRRTGGPYDAVLARK
ncbi:acetylserotonin O-methyltransferase [Pteropus alecto]|uniref:acetylserotonin O-methyltransferase n=1 Tax=Pteropus alecto TaxID=9402 RepID=UPI0003F17C2D|nr:acetylserotonin O-methyltransferase [Pteropus alecto]